MPGPLASSKAASSSGDDAAQRVQNVLATTFGLKLEQCKKGFRMGDHPKWDSMGHMELVANLEREFQVRFPAHVISKIVEFDAIVNAVTQFRK